MSWDAVWIELWAWIAGGLGSLVLAALLWVFRGTVLAAARRFLRWLRAKKRLESQLREREQEIRILKERIDTALTAVGSSSVWLQPPILPVGYFDRLNRSIPIWVFANLKGGVSKTTNATNLAAHYAYSGERVLLIDLDYQGSASSMALRDNQLSTSGHVCKATQLIDGGYTPAMLFNHLETPTVDKDGMIRLDNLHVVPSAWDLADAETRLLIQWLLADRPDDVRYHLASLLHDSSVQQYFNRIIIDAPPRLTTACLQALCTATHVLVPTVLDQLSAEAVHNFIFQVKRLKERGVCPLLKFGPIVGYRAGRAFAHELDVQEGIYKTLRDAGLSKELYKPDDLVPHKPILASSAGMVIAYPRNDQPAPTSEVRAIYKSLANSIQDRAI